MEPFKDIDFLRGKRLSRTPGQKANQDEVRGNEHLGSLKRTNTNREENVNFYTRMLQNTVPMTAPRHRRRITIEPDLSIFHNRSHINPGLFRNSKLAFDHKNKREKISSKKLPSVPEMTFSNIKNSCLVDQGGGEQFEVEPCVLTSSYELEQSYPISKPSSSRTNSPIPVEKLPKTSTQNTQSRNTTERRRHLSPKTIIEYYVPSGDSLNNYQKTSDFSDETIDMGKYDYEYPLFTKKSSTPNPNNNDNLSNIPSSSLSTSSMNSAHTECLSLEKCPLSPIGGSSSNFVDLPYTPNEFSNKMTQRTINRQNKVEDNEGLFRNAFSSDPHDEDLFEIADSFPGTYDLDQKIYDIPKDLLNDDSSTNDDDHDLSFSFDVESVISIDYDLVIED